MPVEVHIRRTKTPITPDEWRAAIEATPNARVKTDDWTAVDPATGATVVTLPHNPLDLDVFFADEDRWVGVFRCTQLRSGQLKISARHTVMAEPAVRAVLRALTKRLGATVETDQGTPYNLRTGLPRGL
jgi:hypothetical protein